MQPEQQPPVNPSEQPQSDIEPQTQQQAYTSEQPVDTQPTAQPVAQPAEYTQPTSPATAPQQSATPARPAEDPGKLFSILGLVCAFIAFQLPGLILSIIGRKKSKKAGYSTTLGTVGIVLNIIFMVLTLGTLALITLVAYQGIQARDRDNTTITNANSIIKKAEIYASENGTYPTIEQLRSASGQAQLSDTDKAMLKDTETPGAHEIGYKTCTDETQTVAGVAIFIYSESESQVSQIAATGECTDSSEQ
jgi:hypothetical protein